jgi:hypothetical protein
MPPPPDADGDGVWKELVVDDREAGSGVAETDAGVRWWWGWEGEGVAVTW